MCAYCNLRYRVIFRLETFEYDQKFYGQLIGVNFDQVNANNSTGKGTDDLSKEYFSTLDTETVVKLYNLLKVDFEMFGYSPDKYFQYTKQNQKQVRAGPIQAQLKDSVHQLQCM